MHCVIDDILHIPDYIKGHAFTVINLFKYLFLFSVYEGIAVTCVRSTGVPDACWGQRKASAHLELELQITVGHHVGPENRLSSLQENQACLITTNYLLNAFI